MRAARPDSHLNVRAGLIIGPHDPTERYTYWVRRVARGGEVLAPVGPDYPIQAIHARDIAEWSLEMAAGQRSGTFNVTSAIYPLGELLEAAKRETGSDARFTYVSEEFLLKQEVGPWMELPLWMPTPMAGLMQTSVAAAQGVGPAGTPAGADDPRDAGLGTRDAAGERGSRPHPQAGSGVAGGLGGALGLSSLVHADELFGASGQAGEALIQLKPDSLSNIWVENSFI